ncbi:hypothetical protein NDU88_005763 [Pleurodeles waltl]|uniref:Uncharacterized protein n=1 Tax=Pleurodeles waltl TaxID=8319 RepID=A0AAV7TY79_PLEWA|nr:hypothetical protein NDU88_005763 [Pleurodeles waltl]
MAAQTTPPYPASLPADSHSMEAAVRILQKIAAVGHRLEAMDSKISDLAVASTSIWADITGFRETVTDLDQRLMTMEAQVSALPDHEAELKSLIRYYCIIELPRYGYSFCSISVIARCLRYPVFEVSSPVARGRMEGERKIEGKEGKWYPAFLVSSPVVRGRVEGERKIEGKER